MNITYRNQVYTVDPCTLLVRESGFYARIEVAGTRVPMVAYIKVTPPVVEVAEPPVDQHWADVQQARIEWNWKHVFVTPEQYASINASVGVRLCVVRNPAPAPITLWHAGLRAA